VKPHLPKLDRRGSILLLSEVETLLGKRSDAIRGYVQQGLLPRPRQVGQAVYWLRAELDEALLAGAVAEKWPGPADADPAAVAMEVEAA